MGRREPGDKPWAHPFTLGVGGVVVQDGHVLLVLMTYGAAKGYWTLPGGFVDRGETPEAAALREVREETGVEAAVESLAGVRFRITPEHRVDTYAAFRMRYVSGAARADQVEVAEARWWPVPAALADEHVAGLTQALIRGALERPGLAPTAVERALVVSPYWQLYT